MTNRKPVNAPIISIAIRAWNEEAVIRRTLESVFQQSLFEELAQRGAWCEVLCIPNGCTDRTAEIAAEVFREQESSHPFSQAFRCRVEEIEEAGRNNTWNAYVHDLSHPDARYLFIMDSDIVFDRPQTLFRMFTALLHDPHASIASDRQIKDIALKERKSLLERISLATTDMTRTIQGQITGQLYCIRAEVARRLYLPKELGAPDDGFIKAIVCTDFFTGPMDPSRIIVAENASHVFEAYVSVAEVLNNQKRQMIGQTTVYLLVEYLKTLPLEARRNLAATLRAMERSDPDWSRRLVQDHVRRVRFFWQLFPDALTFRFKRWWRLRGVRKMTHFPVALVGFLVTLVALARAHRHFRNGQVHYWPKASREYVQRSEVYHGATRSPSTRGAADLSPALDQGLVLERSVAKTASTVETLR